MTRITQDTFDQLEACRDLLIFTAMDQPPPPEDLAKGMIDLYELLFRRIEELRQENGFADTYVTIYDPRKA